MRFALLWLGRVFFLIAVASSSLAQGGDGQITIAQISDTHIGEKRAPHAAENLRTAVRMINARHPDAVILSGDIGENPHDWEVAKSILKELKPHLYYVPGNHDVHSDDVERYREVFGRDYYQFRVKFATFLVIDSQLLGNYDRYEAKSPEPLPLQTEEESERMVAWLNGLQTREKVVIGVQHIPVFYDGRFPDPKPYWIVTDPYRSQELGALHRLGIKHVLVGHWHNGRVFERDGITWHVAPATSWLPWGGELGFAMHAISANGDVRTEFVALPGAKP
jgi:predicted phosphodiesterase